MATSFPVEHEGRPYLITNWHVLSGRDPDSNQLLSPTAAVPDEIAIVHHRAASLGSWVLRTERLLDDNGHRLWIEHRNGRGVDIVALPLTALDEVQLYYFDLALADFDMIPQVAMPVSIIGYPYGIATGVGWPIWKTGHIASDPDVDYDGKPAFLVDATTRGGMSGSPVVLRMTGGYRTSSSTYVIGSGPATRFLGIYAGRIHADAEVGRVWRPHLINEVLQNA